MYETLSWILKFFFVIFIYLFIFRIVYLIYLDIRSLYKPVKYDHSTPYLKLINLTDYLNFPVRETYILDKADLTIGRKSKNSIAIPDPYLSSEHARISSRQNAYYITDLESSNGTYVNGMRIAEVTPLQDGDKVDLGQLSFIFVQKA